MPVREFVMKSFLRADVLADEPNAPIYYASDGGAQRGLRVLDDVRQRSLHRAKPRRERGLAGDGVE